MKRPILFALLACALAAPCAARADETKTFPRGAVRSPAHKLLAAPRHEPIANPPAQVAYVPKQLDMWGNSQFGCCVTSEEEFAKACYSPEIFIAPQIGIEWARRHGYLNGADLVSVLDTMQTDGFTEGHFARRQQYNDGPYSAVDYSSEDALHSALSIGPVKIAIDANALPSGAGNQQGWYALGSGQQFTNTDHCVSICGCGTAEYLYSQLNVQMPPSVAGTSGYLVFTWSTIGFVDHPWIMSTCTEAFVRNPTTVGVPPLPGPTPDPTPPNPAPPAAGLSFGEAVQLVVAAAKTDLTQSQAEGIAAFFGDERSPRVSLLEELVYRRALRAGKIPAGTPLSAVNWQQLIQFIQAMMPTIEQFIVLFGGDTPHAALLEQHGVEATLIVYAPQSVKQCGPNGCPVAPPAKRIAPLRPFAPKARRRARLPVGNGTPSPAAVKLGDCIKIEHRTARAGSFPAGGGLARRRLVADFVRLS